MTKKQEYRVYLSLSEEEAIALTKLGDRELRDRGKQAKYLLLQKLRELGLLSKKDDQGTGENASANGDRNELS